MRNVSEGCLAEINDFMQGYRVFCVAMHKDAELMWERYAQNHLGIVLKIEPAVDKDSKFQLFKPVEYCASRPSLYDDTLEFLEGSLFGNQEAKRLAMLDKIIYAKTLAWDGESEYRLAIPLGEDEADWDTEPFHVEEITEMYLGVAMTERDRADIVAKAKALNPKITIFQTRRDAEGPLVFDAVEHSIGMHVQFANQ